MTFRTDNAEGEALHDMPRIAAILRDVARAGRAVSYSEMLMALGLRFTRPRMRALCKTLDMIDSNAQSLGEPDLAVLVVRESDRLPGQGWWVGRANAFAYHGPWTGAEAAAFVAAKQARAFDYWRDRTDPR
jgi:hypothetical protein